MKPLVFVGIDPGLDGAIVGILEDGQRAFHAEMPCQSFESKQKTRSGKNRIRNVYDEDAIVALLEAQMKLARIHAVLERGSSRPGEAAQSAFGFGVAYGTLAGILSGLRVPNVRPYPVTWRARVIPNVRGIEDERARKKAAAVEVVKMFPWADAVIWGPKGGLRDGLADACLLAEYGRRRARDEFRGQPGLIRYNGS